MKAELKPLAAGDKHLFERFLSPRRPGLSAFSFANIYGWSSLFEVRWAVIRSSLCVFFSDTIGSFLYLPPLGKTFDPAVVDEVFGILDGLNKNGRVSRIENAEEWELGPFIRAGYRAVFKSHEYLYSRESLSALKGDGFKSKRAPINHFVRNNRFECLPYSERFRSACVGLYERWSEGRAERNSDTVYRGMLRDSRLCLVTALEEFSRLGMEGRVLLVDGSLKAFTLGYPLTAETFCVFFEISDLSVKGSGQFIFRDFCRSLSGYRWINVMDDSGLENLKKVKMSYRPAGTPAGYIIDRHDS